MTVAVTCVGTAVYDIVFRLDAEPTVGSKNFASAMSVSVGGPAMTAAGAVTDLGGEAIVVTRVGTDPQGVSVIRDLETKGIRIDHIERLDGVATSVSSVMVHGDGERTIVNFTEEKLLSEAGPMVDAAVDAAGVVLTDVRWIAGTKPAVARARASGKPVIIDFDLTPGDSGRGLVEMATHVVFSSAALASLYPSVSVSDALAAVVSTTDAAVGVTLGAAGSLWAVGGRIVEVPGFSVPVVSTLGAGDIFHGAFALAIGEGRTVLDAARFATAAGAVWCMIEPGTGTRLVREDVETMEGSR